VTEQRRIVVKCIDCGINRVPLEAVVVRYCLDDERWTYRFRCPDCDCLAASRSSARAAFAAVMGGAVLETWRFPAEVDERPSGPPITWSDLLELHLALDEPDFIDSLHV
jgi:hypothetical protein